jgi:hypothetical protein
MLSRSRVIIIISKANTAASRRTDPEYFDSHMIGLQENEMSTDRENGRGSKRAGTSIHI